MATFVITFFLFALFYIFKMDADCKYSRRDRAISRRKQRWSMNSQRLEEIVAELVKPIGDIRRSFDTDLSALLEEYLTEAGLRALDADEEEDGAAAVVVPNFTELALLLQRSASLYSRKVDYLYDHVLLVSESFHCNTQEPSDAVDGARGGGEPQTPSSRRRRRTVGAEFVEIELEPCASSAREGGAHPPPTLPHMYIDLEPRVLTDADVPLRDHNGEPIGLLTDFHVTWRLQEGLLVEELESVTRETETPLQSLSLVELQRAMAANTPPLPPPAPSRLSPAPMGSSTPLHEGSPAPSPLPVPIPLPEPVTLRIERKRKNNMNVDDLLGHRIHFLVGEELIRKLRKVDEYSIPGKWIAKVVHHRKTAILSLRSRLKAHEPRPPNIDFIGFDFVSPLDAGGFTGWTESEVLSAVALAKTMVRLDESDDDGFFERSSVGDSDGSRVDDSALNHTTIQTVADTACDWLAWQTQVLRRAAEEEARGGMDVRALGTSLLASCSKHKQDAIPFATVLREKATEQADVSRLLLSTLFLANSGNVEIVQGPPLSVGSFSVRVLSTDEPQFSTAAGAETDARFLS